MPHRLERLVLGLLTRADAAANRWYGSRLNPLYQSGTIVVALYVTLVVTGVWLLLFYRVGAPWESVDRITANPWLGNWVRGLHRYATDAAVVFTAIHAARMFAQARAWGARAMAWISGVALVLLMLQCAWTGYVLVWDTFGERLAREGARMVDALPVLSEPVGRAFTGEQPVPSVFFFITLFAHIGIPLGMGVVFWLHVKRLQRPALLPPRAIGWTVLAVLGLVALFRPMVMAPRADPFTQPSNVPTDLFVAFWLPLTEAWTGGQVLGGITVAAALLLVWPALAARRGAAARAPSVVDEDLCTGCTQCATDCPYGAIEMVERADGRATLVAHVTPSLCVSCGICAGSCAPMGVGPPGRTGRDQLAAAHAFAGAHFKLAALAEMSPHGTAAGKRPPAADVVVIACANGARAFAQDIRNIGASLFPVTCAGNLHSSVVEHLLRGGARGVMVLACPPRDCWNREGARWLHERLYEGREAELQARVPRDRVRVAYVNAAERKMAVAATRAFAEELAARAAAVAPASDDDAVCDRVREAVRP